MVRIIFIIIFSLYSYSIFANAVGEYTGLPIPRFVSLKSNDSNLRIGSSTNYPIILKYNIANLPLEIIDEYGDWRKTNDIENNQGWIHKSLLKGNRFAIINPPYEESIQIFNKPKGKVIGRIGKRNIVKIEKCLINWCFIAVSYTHLRAHETGRNVV